MGSIQIRDGCSIATVYCANCTFSCLPCVSRPGKPSIFGDHQIPIILHLEMDNPLYYGRVGGRLLHWPDFANLYRYLDRHWFRGLGAHHAGTHQQSEISNYLMYEYRPISLPTLGPLRTRRDQKSECCQESHRKSRGTGPAVAFIMETQQNASPHFPSLWENKAVTIRNKMSNGGALVSF